MELIRVAKANGQQLQAVCAKMESVKDLPLVWQAIYCRDPSPMQIRTLRSALTSVGIPYIKENDGVYEPAADHERFEAPLQKALATMASLIKGGRAAETRSAGKCLYKTVQCKSTTQALEQAKHIVAYRNFVRVSISDTKEKREWLKTVKVKRKTYTALVTVESDTLSLTVFKG